MTPEQGLSAQRSTEPVDCAWFSSGTAALIAALEAVGARGKWVAVPPNICPNIVAAVLAVDSRPWFVDIEPERQGVDPARLSEIIAEVAAVVAVHAYGTPCRIDAIMEVARRAAVPVIEDCAQADGASYAGCDVGVFGDISVFSFGTGKIIDAGGGGLAIATDRRLGDALRSTASQWTETTDMLAGEDLGSVYRFYYNSYYPDRTAYVRQSFFALLKDSAPRFKYKLQAGGMTRIQAARNDRQMRIDSRRNKYRAYCESLAGIPQLTPTPLVEGAAPWRFNAVLEVGRRDEVFRTLIQAGRKASTWYPRISEFLPENEIRSESLPVAAFFEKALLNLWIDDETSLGDIEIECKRIRQALD